MSDFLDCHHLGQPMTIAFDMVAPRNPRVRSASGPPTTASLLNRIQKPPLLDRLSRDDSSIKTPSGPYVPFLPQSICNVLIDFIDAAEDHRRQDLPEPVNALQPTPMALAQNRPADQRSRRPQKSWTRN